MLIFVLSTDIRVEVGGVAATSDTGLGNICAEDQTRRSAEKLNSGSRRVTEAIAYQEGGCVIA